MTTWYCDANTQINGLRRVWGLGDHATETGDNWGTVLSDVIDAAADGDTIKVYAGQYDLPEEITKSLLIASTGDVEFNFTPGVITTELDEMCQIAEGAVVRFFGGTITGSMAVIGSLVLDSVADSVSGKIYDTGAVVAIGDAVHNFAADQQGSFAHYPAYFDEGRWPSQFAIAQYRNAAVLEAPAKYRGDSGQSKTRWVPIRPFRYLVKDGVAGETQAASVSFAEQASTIFTKPGLPAHQDMRISTRGRIMQIKGVSRPSGPGQDLRLTVTEYTGM